MTPRKLLILAIVAVVAVGGGIWLAGRQASTTSGDTAVLYPDLKKELDAITAIRVVKAGGATAVELKRGESGWTVSERSNYPADDAKLRKLVTNIAEAKLLEEKTSTVENYPTLGVEDISSDGAGGMQVEIDGPKQPVKLIVGKQATGAQSHYVRRAGEPKSWLINKDVDTSASPDQWLRKNILDVSADRVQSAEVTVAGAKPYSALKKTRADADFTVEGLPKGKELSSPSAADSFASSLSGLTLTDVQPVTAVTGEPNARATLKTFDGLIAEASGWKKDDKHYLALKTSFDAAQAERFKVATAEAEKKDAAAEPGKADEKKADAANSEGAPPAADKAAAPAAAKLNVEEEASKANALATGWVYEIPAYKYDAIFKPVDELIKK
ncbi:MAG: DUF4340 domain-containing protein [Steroidobacter sp.]